MKPKFYPPHEEKPMVVSEPSIGYGHATVAKGRRVYQVTEAERAKIMQARDQFARGEYYTEEEMDKMVKEWLN